ncbi:Hypothetical protein LUCI_3771 [Lucifera butyrica]|uniref:Stage II sporulation protein P n=1 Tax=Lucifera butyrica TaxID=1351585 RepID=A0A498RH80_9FIRM|nr:stage II sporulation protein P [Lucifera butyrica]VBB08498.1 Hypothetical protein LUCI_3771 [Lucifera butyrica]
MITKRRAFFLAGILLLCIIVLAGTMYLLPLHFLQVQQKPEQPPQPVYDYYLILDEATGNHLMYVPLVVSVGDQVLSEDNKLYEIVKIEENRAYARFVRDVNLEQYKK